MGTLEVHDPQGRVQFVMLTKQHPIVFGASPSCDVVLIGEGIRPVEGRIRWKKTKFKVEASPDAEFVLVNGSRMAQAGLRPGDEIAVGACRIFLMRDDDEDEPPAGPPADEREEKTRVQAPPLIRERVEVVADRPPPAPTPGPSSRKGAKAPSLESDDWLEVIEPAVGPEKADDDEDDPPTMFLPGSAKKSKKAPETKQPGRTGFFRRLKASKAQQVDAPGHERLLSPLVVGLLTSLAVLLLLGVTIYTVLVKTLATRLYSHAVESLDSGDYVNAIRDFDVFLASNAEDSRAGKARVLRGLASVRQYVTPGGGMWTNALEAGRTMYDELRDEPEFLDERAELGEILLRIGEGLSDRARASADRRALVEAESVIPLHAEVAGEAAKALLGRSDLPAKLNEARAAIRKSETRAAALLAIDGALKAGSAKGVYAARDELLRQYGDLAADPELTKRLVEANELVRRAVKVRSIRRPADTQPRPEPMGPPVGLVLRSSVATVSASPAAESIVFALSDGFAIGLDGANGAPLWQRPVGLSSPFVPRVIAGDPSCLVVDARYNDLVRLNSETGGLIWRQALGEPVDDPPLVLGNQVFQCLPGGTMLVMALDSGEIQAAVDTGFPIGRAPIADESGRNLYLVARRDCLLVLARDPLGCASAEYLGHSDGSIPCSPSRLGRFLIVPENHTLTSGRWRIFVLNGEGTQLKPIQEVPIAGWTWSPPPLSGSIVWSASDRGALEAFSVGDYSASKPFKSTGRLEGDSRPNGPVYALAPTERELWVSSVHSGRFDLDAERGALTVRFGLGQTGPAVGPIQLSDRLLVMTFQDPGTMGTSLLAVDPETGVTPWRSIVGARWVAPPTPAAAGPDIKLTTIDPSGSPAEIPRTLLDSGGPVTFEIRKSGEFSLPAGDYRQFEVGGRPVLVPGVGSRFVWVKGVKDGKPNAWAKVDLPAPLSAGPLAWGGGLLIPAADSRIYVIDPGSSRSIVEPFVPVFDRDRQESWMTPAVIDPENLIVADEEGRIRRLGLRGDSDRRLVVEADLTLDRKPTASPVSTSKAVVIATADGKVRALAPRDLSPIGSWPCKGRITTIPRPVEGRFFIPDDSGEVLALSADARRLWAIDLGAGVVGDPVVIGRSAWFLTIDGVLHGRDIESGTSQDRIELHVLPASGPIASGREGELIIPVARGAYQTLRIPKQLERKP